MASPTILAVLLAAAPEALATSPFGLSECKPNEEAAVVQPCVLPLRLSAKVASRLLSGRDSVWWLAGDRLTVLARRDSNGSAQLCCSFQGPLIPLPGSELSSVSLRIPRVNEALLDITILGSDGVKPPDVIRGFAAPPAPAQVQPLEGRLINTALRSETLGESRELIIYVPPNIPAHVRLPTIYVADGETLPAFAGIAESAVARGQASPALIVGIHSARGRVSGCAASSCDKRNLEYIPAPEERPQRRSTDFDRHLRFVTEELVPYIESRYPASARRQDRITAGYSSGAVWAFSAAALRPETFGGVLGMSAGGRSTISYASRLADARIFAGAGIFEPMFHKSTRRRAELAREAGAEVQFTEIVSGHSSVMWEVLFAQGLSWLLNPSLTSAPGASRKPELEPPLPLPARPLT